MQSTPFEHDDVVDAVLACDSADGRSLLQRLQHGLLFNSSEYTRWVRRGTPASLLLSDMLLVDSDYGNMDAISFDVQTVPDHATRSHVVANGRREMLTSFWAEISVVFVPPLLGTPARVRGCRGRGVSIADGRKAAQ